MAFSGTIEVESISRGGDPIQFTLYDLEADPTIRISLAYEVDCYFWKKQNLLPQWITST